MHWISPLSSRSQLPRLPSLPGAALACGRLATRNGESPGGRLHEARITSAVLRTPRLLSYAAEPALSTLFLATPRGSAAHDAILARAAARWADRAAYWRARIPRQHRVGAAAAPHRGAAGRAVRAGAHQPSECQPSLASAARSAHSAAAAAMLLMCVARGRQPRQRAGASGAAAVAAAATTCPACYASAPAAG